MPDARAKSLRQNATDAERRLWAALRAKRFNNFKFRRQERLGPYVADFVCFAHRLIVEVDGGQHGEVVDSKRTAELEHRGFKVIRFWNNEVMENLAGVLDRIADVLAETAPSPGRLRRPPSPIEGGECFT